MEELITQLHNAALAAVNPEIAIANWVSKAGNQLTIGDRHYDLDRWQIRCIALGKGALPMAQALDRVLGAEIVAGLVVTNDLGKHQLPQQWQAIEAGHPIPDARSLAAGDRVEQFVSDCTKQTLLIAGLSGGASALVTAPRSLLALRQLLSTDAAAANLLAPIQAAIPTDLSDTAPIPLSLIEKINRALLTSGCDITMMNTIRSQLDRLKGGGLVERALPATVVGLILSDVIGDSFATIASGLTDRPNAVNWLIGSNSQACAAVKKTAMDLGYTATIVTTKLDGEAQLKGREIVHTIGTQPPRTIYIYGGETTVTIPADCTGIGGRNQELALAAAIELHQRAIPAWVATLATDGIDGPTDAAGAIVNEQTLERAIALGLDAQLALERHDSYPFFDRLGGLGLIRRGATRTNVADVTIAIRP